MGMIDDQILMAFLDKRSAIALAEIKEKGALSENNAMPLMLKSQFNHIAHLDLKLTDLESRFGEITKQMQGLVTHQEFQKEVSNIKSEFRWLIGSSIAFISILMTVLQVFIH
jgi:hypothetical protein